MPETLILEKKEDESDPQILNWDQSIEWHDGNSYYRSIPNFCKYLKEENLIKLTCFFTCRECHKNMNIPISINKKNQKKLVVKCKIENCETTKNVVIPYKYISEILNSKYKR